MYGINYKKNFNTSCEINPFLNIQNYYSSINKISKHIQDKFSNIVHNNDIYMMILFRFSKLEFEVNDDTFTKFLSLNIKSYQVLVNYFIDKILLQWEILPIKDITKEIYYFYNKINFNIVICESVFIEKFKNNLNFSKIKELTKLLTKFNCFICKQYISIENIANFRELNSTSYQLCFNCCNINGLYLDYFRCLICTDKCKNTERLCGNNNCKQKNSFDFLISKLDTEGNIIGYLNILALRDKKIKDDITIFDIVTNYNYKNNIIEILNNDEDFENKNYIDIFSECCYKNRLKKMESKTLTVGQYENKKFIEIYDIDPFYFKNIEYVFPYFSLEKEWELFISYCKLRDYYNLMKGKNDVNLTSDSLFIYNNHHKCLFDTLNKEQIDDIKLFMNKHLPFVKNIDKLTYLDICRNISFQNLCEYLIKKKYNDEFIKYLKIFINFHYPLILNVNVKIEDIKKDPSSWSWRALNFYITMNNQ